MAEFRRRHQVGEVSERQAFDARRTERLCETTDEPADSQSSEAVLASRKARKGLEQRLTEATAKLRQ